MSRVEKMFGWFLVACFVWAGIGAIAGAVFSLFHPDLISYFIPCLIVTIFVDFIIYFIVNELLKGGSE